MPLYEYKCPSCLATHDLLLPMKAKRPKQIKCKSCAFGRMNQVAHPRTGAPQFKGSGWAGDGYRSVQK